MNRLLSILFLSLSFIGSANANSIEVAFGYKLGQVVSDVIVTDWGVAHEAAVKVSAPLTVTRLESAEVGVMVTAEVGALCRTTVHCAVAPSTTFTALAEISTVAASTAVASHASASSNRAAPQRPLPP